MNLSLTPLPTATAGTLSNSWGETLEERTSNLYTGDEVRDAFVEALGLIYDSVSSTLGPKARTALVQHEGRPPTVLNDGVKIVSAVKSNKPQVQAALDLLRQTALEAQQASGDGTTTATVMAHRLVTEVLGGPMEDLHGELRLIEIDRKIAINNLWAMCGQIDMDDEDLVQLKRVATVASNNDEELGELIRDVFAEIGKDGIVNLKVGEGEGCYWRETNGSEVPSGFTSPMFANTPHRAFEADNPLFLITKETIEDFDDLTPALEVAVENNRPLVVFCQDIKGVAQSNLVANVVGGVVKACAIKVPYNDPDDWFEDMFALVGGKIHFESGMETGIAHAVAGAEIPHFGSAERIVVTEDSTTIITGEVKSERLKEHAAALARRAKEASHPFTAQKLETRRNRLLTNMASIYIGGFTDAEIRETRERVDDAVNATRLAIKNGILVGGGWSLWKASPSMGALGVTMNEPSRLLRENAGLLNDNPTNTRYLNTKTSKMERASLEEATVLDPTSVVVNSLNAACSIARLVLLTNVIITNQ